VRPIQLRILSAGNRVIHRLSGGRLGSLEAGNHAPRGRALKLITSLHLRLYRWTGGIIGGDAGGLATLLLTTVGRKTGQARTVPLPYFPFGDAFVVVASFAGNPKHPAWYQNLVATPDVAVQIKRRKIRGRARTANADERRTLWPAVTASAPMYADYQRVTGREIPLVILEPRLD
jgi:deazaflavin-dependent oxidoreductase (nitroreductase family)